MAHLDQRIHGGGRPGILHDHVPANAARRATANAPPPAPPAAGRSEYDSDDNPTRPAPDDPTVGGVSRGHPIARPAAPPTQHVANPPRRPSAAALALAGAPIDGVGVGREEGGDGAPAGTRSGPGTPRRARPVCRRALACPGTPGPAPASEWRHDRPPCRPWLQGERACCGSRRLRRLGRRFHLSHGGPSSRGALLARPRRARLPRRARGPDRPYRHSRLAPPPFPLIPHPFSPIPPPSPVIPPPPRSRGAPGLAPFRRVRQSRPWRAAPSQRPWPPAAKDASPAEDYPPPPPPPPPPSPRALTPQTRRRGGGT